MRPGRARAVRRRVGARWCRAPYRWRPADGQHRQEHGIDTVNVPFEDAPEAGLVEGTTVIPVKTLAELAAHLSGERPLAL
jgi:hypothetical protein